MVDVTQSLGWIINPEKSELKPTQVFLFVGYEYHLYSALVKTSGFDPMTQVKTCLTTRCLMLLIGLHARMEKMVPEGRLHEALSVSPQGALEISPRH